MIPYNFDYFAWVHYNHPHRDMFYKGSPSYNSLLAAAIRRQYFGE